MPTIDPVAAVLSFQLMARKRSGAVDYRAGGCGSPQFRQSPISHLIERNLGAQRLEDREAVDKFPLFQELRALGITEYAL
jgi:hypothetical protein